MKVLTIKQPWAQLIIEGDKEYEFRSWKTNYRGDILIHAGKSIDKEAIKRFECYNLEYPTGSIIAKATMSDCIEVTEKFRCDRKDENELVYRGIQDRNWNGFGFKMENVEEIEPIEINGQLGLWNYDYK